MRVSNGATKAKRAAAERVTQSTYEEAKRSSRWEPDWSRDRSLLPRVNVAEMVKRRAECRHAEGQNKT